MSQSTVFQLCRDGSSWVEPVLSKDKCILIKDTTQWGRWGSNLLPLCLESSTLPLCSLLSLVTDNNLSWVSGRRRMFVEIILWSISTKYAIVPDQTRDPWICSRNFLPTALHGKKEFSKCGFWKKNRQQKSMQNFQPYIRWYTSPNENFEYGYPHSNAFLQFHLKLDCYKPYKATHHPKKCDVINDFKLFQTVNRTISCRKFWRYSIRHHVTTSSALKCNIMGES